MVGKAGMSSLLKKYQFQRNLRALTSNLFEGHLAGFHQPDDTPQRTLDQILHQKNDLLWLQVSTGKLALELVRVVEKLIRGKVQYRL